MTGDVRARAETAPVAATLIGTIALPSAVPPFATDTYAHLVGTRCPAKGE
jgi:hypothetical protein